MELAKLTSKGKIVFQIESQIALSELQKQMAGQALKANFQSEEDVISYIKSMRSK